MTLEISAAFATSFDTPDHVVAAERLGYARAWFYDSPALYPDVWIAIAESARRTSRIGLGPGVLVPSLRHPMTNAAAIAHVEHLAPGRLHVAIGSGFTGRLTMGQRPLKWAYVRAYVMAVKALLAGDTVEWEGGLLRMMHPEGYAPPRPIHVPIILGTNGPKGNAVAHEIADGVFSTSPVTGFARCAILAYGTVLGEGEDPGSDRVLDAAGHGAAVALHATYDRGGDVSRFPNGAEWRARMDAIPAAERHLTLHDRHLIGVSEHDRPVLTGPFLARAGGVRTAEEWRAHLAALEAAGATELAYQPAGTDIEGELARFADAVGLRAH